MSTDATGSGSPEADSEPGPSNAQRARALLAATSVGHLSTVSVDHPGYPFGSLVAYALDGDGNPILLLSDLAEHTTNLKADPRASLMATEVSIRPGDALALGRATLVGDLSKATDDEREECKALYLQAHPDTMYADFADFNFYRLTVNAVRYVGGFGRMSWVDSDDWATTSTERA